MVRRGSILMGGGVMALLLAACVLPWFPAMGTLRVEIDYSDWKWLRPCRREGPTHG